jgi:hypothetical protein
MGCVLTLGRTAGSLLLINLEKNNRILLSVKRTMKEGKETYLLCLKPSPTRASVVERVEHA